MRTISRRARPHTVTVYNYISTTAGAAAYQRTVLDHVQLDPAYQQRLTQRGIQTDDQAFMVLDLSDYTATNGRTFIAAESWPALTAAQKAPIFHLPGPGRLLRRWDGCRGNAVHHKGRHAGEISVQRPPPASKAAPPLEVTGMHGKDIQPRRSEGPVGAPARSVGWTVLKAALRSPARES